jgi:2-methylisocitrate lyase-like PEP mutase family enzyme
MIIGRTDAYGALGLDAALRRAERFLRAGVDGVFVAGLRREEDFERVGRELKGATLSAAIFEGVGTPWLSPAELATLGFRHVSFPATLIFRAVASMQATLAALRAHAKGLAPMQPAVESAASRAVLDQALHVDQWQRLETRESRTS